MSTTPSIVEVSATITKALRQRGFFDPGGDDRVRADLVPEAVGAAAAELGMKLTPSKRPERGAFAVLAEGVPGMITVVAQRRLADGLPEGRPESINPDFGVTWSPS